MAVEHLRVVGIGHLSDEVLPDDLYPRQRLVVSADVAARYACSFALRPDMGRQELGRTLFHGCSTQYRYYSLELDPGDLDRRHPSAVRSSRVTTDTAGPRPR